MPMSLRYDIVFLNLMYICSTMHAEELCPKVCNICFNDHLSCTNGGLHSFPLMILDSTTKITLIGHMFDSTILSKANFSRFAKPKYSLEQLSIRQSNVDRILSKTFYDLSGLDNLDLSDNRRIVVESMAFSNLKLKHLKLDKIHMLILKKGAFDGLMVASLSIKNSRIKTLPYDLFTPISQNLRNLFLSSNHIRFLEPKFEGLFQQLTRLELTGNPFQCTCDLLWLGRVILERIRRSDTGDATFTYNGLYSMSPSCVGPAHVRNRLIHNISEAEFNCIPPSLDVIDVKFQNNHLVRLQCSAKMTLKSVPIQMIWQQLTESEQITYPQVAESDSNHATINVKRTARVNLYRCLAISNSGNASVKISITWPTLVNNTEPSDVTKFSDKADWFIKQNKMSETNFFFKEQFTLLEMLGAVVGTFTVTLTAFLLLYRFCFRSPGKKKTSSIKKSGYSIYEPAVYNDSQTYDVPQNPYGIASQTFINKTLPNNATSHYIDYLTQQRISHH